MNEEGQVGCRCGQCLTRRCYVRELALYRSMRSISWTQIDSDYSPVPSMNAAASCSPSASPMAVSAHPGPLSGPVERSTALHWSWNILLACSEPRNLVREDSYNLGAPTAFATPPRRILPDPSVRERGRVQQCKIYARCRVTGHMGGVVAFVLWNLLFTTLLL